MYKIKVGAWRKDSAGPMQVVSGAIGAEKVHYQAPDAAGLALEMQRFIAWFNQKKMDPVIKAAVAHFWFVTIHPFEDGNGRITRALTDMLLARADKSSQRCYSMSAQILAMRKQYYEVLEHAQKGDLDISPWIVWFLDCLIQTLKSTESTLTNVLFKAEFWQEHIQIRFNERQRKLLNKLLDGFEGKLTTSKWAKIAKCSKDSVVRDIKDLMEKGILYKEAAGGRSTNYALTRE
jgi:Fic family protein